MFVFGKSSHQNIRSGDLWVVGCVWFLFSWITPWGSFILARSKSDLAAILLKLRDTNLRHFLMFSCFRPLLFRSWGLALLILPLRQCTMALLGATCFPLIVAQGPSLSLASVPEHPLGHLILWWCWWWCWGGGRERGWGEGVGGERHAFFPSPNPKLTEIKTKRNF